MKPLDLTALILAFCLPGCGGGAPFVRTQPPPHQTPAFAAVTGRLIVEVEEIPTLQGQLFVELYDRESYFDYARLLDEVIVPVTGHEMVVPLEHVPPGRYIVVASHDANSNRVLDRGLFGKPTEAYGFSGDARGFFGPPSFEEGAINFVGGDLRVPIRVE
jgi:uncharacterized protein (DUF2141 family)